MSMDPNTPPLRVPTAGSGVAGVALPMGLRAPTAETFLRGIPRGAGQAAAGGSDG